MLVRLAIGLIVMTCAVGTLEAQSTAGNYFNQGANLFLHNETDKALSTVEEGIANFPTDERLKKLRELLLKQQQNPQNQNDQNQDQDQNQNQDNQNKSGRDQNEQESPRGSGEDDKKDESEKEPKAEPDLKEIPQQEVEKILNAIKNDEKELQNLLIRQKKQRDTQVEKDW